MTGREELAEGGKGKALAPSAEKTGARVASGSLARSKGFAITDLLGLEAELQPPGPAASSGGEGCGPAAMGAGGALPLGLGFLCGFAPQQPAGAHCLLPAHLPFLPPPRPEPPHQPRHHPYGTGAAEKHKGELSGKPGGGGPAWPGPVPALWKRRTDTSGGRPFAGLGPAGAWPGAPKGAGE